MLMKNKWLENLQNEFHQKTIGAFQEKMNEMYEAIGVESPNQKDNEGIDNNSPKKYENIIFGAVSTVKAVKGIKPNTENTPIDDKEFKNTNWDAFLMKSIDDALDSLKKIAISAFKDENKKFVKTLFLQTHGNASSIGILGKNIAVGSPTSGVTSNDEDGLDDSKQVGTFEFEQYLIFLESKKETIEQYVKDKNWSDPNEISKTIDYLTVIDKLTRICEYIVDGGTLILGGCNIGEIYEFSLFDYFAENIIKYRINCIANQDVTSGATNVITNGVLTRYKFLDNVLTKTKPNKDGTVNFKLGWRMINTKGEEDNRKKNLRLLSKGNISYEFVFDN